MSGEDEWTPGPDGILERNAARVVLIDEEGRIFLIRGHDTEDPNHSWWFTVGGGIDPGEDPVDGAARELYEETGLAVDPDRLVGPVLQRSAVFRFTFHLRRQYERFYLLHVSNSEAESISLWNQDYLTELEKEVLDEVAWWRVDEIESAQQTGVAIYPEGIAQLAKGWFEGWDGSLTVIEDG